MRTTSGKKPTKVGELTAPGGTSESALENQWQCGEDKGKDRSGMSEADAPVVGNPSAVGC